MSYHGLGALDEGTLIPGTQVRVVSGGIFVMGSNCNNARILPGLSTSTQLRSVGVTDATACSRELAAAITASRSMLTTQTIGTQTQRDVAVQQVQTVVAQQIATDVASGKSTPEQAVVRAEQAQVPVEKVVRATAELSPSTANTVREAATRAATMSPGKVALVIVGVVGAGAIVMILLRRRR